MKPKTLLLRGAPGIGKTTLLQKVVSSLKGYRIRGLLTDEIKQDGRRVGFQLPTQKREKCNPRPRRPKVLSPRRAIRARAPVQ